jgi:protein-tyrosine phosphatase
MVHTLKLNKGLFLVHEERDCSKLLPVWVEIETIQTTLQVFDEMRLAGFNVNYFRIPFSPEEAPDYRCIHDYLKVIKSTRNDDSVVVNCGMGVGRSLFN